MGIDVRDYWNFDDPAASEAVFRDLLARGGLSLDEELEVWAQIARTYSLRRDCVMCHQLLDGRWNEAMSAGPRPKACFELEQGRSFRTGKELAKAIPFFELAAESEADDLRVDALHMLAIDADAETSHRIHVQALAIARNSANPWAQRWQGTLLNNMGWAYFGADKFEEALSCFRDALAQREKVGNAGQIRIAKWCVGRCLRALGQFEEALSIQQELKKQGGDGYV
ncbi:MAG: tetratricopeptide repeat protein, partial [Armatimonadota bacterium]